MPDENQVNGYDVFEHEIVSEPEPNEDEGDDDE